MGRRAHGQPVVRGNVDIPEHHFAPFVPHSCALRYPTRAVTWALLSVDARRMLIGACNLTVGPNWGIREGEQVWSKATDCTASAAFLFLDPFLTPCALVASPLTPCDVLYLVAMVVGC